MSRLVCLAVAIVLAVCAFWYHRHVVNGYEAELASIKGVYAQTQAKIAGDTSKIFIDALAKREVQYASINASGKQAAVSISQAASDVDGVDLDGLLPVSVSDALLMHYEGICSGSVCGFASGSAVQAEADSISPNGARK